MSICSSGLGEAERLVVSPRRAKHMLDCGNTRLYELLNAGELESYLDGRSRKIVVASITAYIERQLAASAGNKRSTVEVTGKSLVGRREHSREKQRPTDQRGGHD